jgi:hypothetical protein
MKTSVPCPACTKPISVLRVATAPTPLHLRCPSCMRPLRVKNLTLPTVVAGIGFGIYLGQWLLREARLVGGLPVRAMLIAIAVVIVADLAFSFAVVNFGKLTKRD